MKELKAFYDNLETGEKRLLWMIGGIFIVIIVIAIFG